MAQANAPAHVGYRWLFERYAADRGDHAYRIALYRAIRAGKFPAPLVTGDRSRAWRLTDVLRWEASLNPVPYAPPQPASPEAA